MEEIRRTVGSGCIVAVCSLQLSKTFDTIIHAQVVLNLMSYGANRIQDGLFRAAHGWWKKTSLYLQCVTHFLQWRKLAVIPYLNKIQKMYESYEILLEFWWHHHFFIRNQKILLCQEMQIYTAFWYITSSSFDFSWVFKDCFNKHGWNFADVSKIGYPRPS